MECRERGHQAPGSYPSNQMHRFLRNHEIIGIRNLRKRKLTMANIDKLKEEFKEDESKSEQIEGSRAA
jgi:hypothetical protein